MTQSWVDREVSGHLGIKTYCMKLRVLGTLQISNMECMNYPGQQILTEPKVNKGITDMDSDFPLFPGSYVIIYCSVINSQFSQKSKNRIQSLAISLYNTRSRG